MPEKRTQAMVSVKALKKLREKGHELSGNENASVTECLLVVLAELTRLQERYRPRYRLTAKGEKAVAAHGEPPIVIGE